MPWQNLLPWSLQAWIMVDCCLLLSPLYNKIYPSVKKIAFLHFTTTATWNLWIYFSFMTLNLNILCLNTRRTALPPHNYGFIFCFITQFMLIYKIMIIMRMNYSFWEKVTITYCTVCFIYCSQYIIIVTNTDFYQTIKASIIRCVGKITFYFVFNFALRKQSNISFMFAVSCCFSQLVRVLLCNYF